MALVVSAAVLSLKIANVGGHAQFPWREPCFAPQNLQNRPPTSPIHRILGGMMSMLQHSNVIAKEME